MLEHDELSVRRRRRAAGEIEELAVRRLRERWERPNAEVKLDDLAEAVARGVLDPYAAAQAVAVEGEGLDARPETAREPMAARRRQSEF